MRQAIIVPVILLLAGAIQPSVAQTVYQLPFGSTDNSIELTVANTSTLPLSGVTVEAMGLPGWLKFKETKQSLGLLKGEQETPVLFTFSVDKSAPVKKVQTITFAISSKGGDKWSKELKVMVAPPDHVELFQNFPNPFNPTTTISYQLSADSRISLKIFNILGQEVATLVDGERLAGHHEERWEAKGFASGMYVYQLFLTDEQGNRQVARKTLVLLK